MASIAFDHAEDIAFAEYRQTIADSEARDERLSQALAQQLESWRMQALVHAVMTLRGLDLIAATTVVVELGDLRRFAAPAS